MNHSVKRRRQALHQTHQHYYLNIVVEAANLSDWRIEPNRKNLFGSENRIESKLFCPNWNALSYRRDHFRQAVLLTLAGDDHDAHIFLAVLMQFNGPTLCCQAEINFSIAG